MSTVLLLPAAVQSAVIPADARPTILGVGIAYLAVVAGIAVWAGRRTHTREDFFLAGKAVGLLALTFAALASTFSSFTFLGGPSFVYLSGLGAMMFVLPATLTNALSAWVLAKRLRLVAEIRDVLTLPDVLGLRYGSRAVQGLSAIAILLGVIGYMATQVAGLGAIMDSVFGLGYGWGIWIGTAIVLAYAVTGGIKAGIYTDLAQGVLMAAASILVFLFVLEAGEGLGGISRTILAAEPEFLSPWGLYSPLAAVSLYFVFSVGVLGQPHVMHKFFMIREPRRLKWYPLLVTVAMVVVILIMFGIGVAVKALVIRGEMPPVADADNVAPFFLLGHTPVILAAVVFSGIAAAIMSSVDSFVNVGAAALTHDLPKALGFRLGSELRWGRVATLVLAVAAALTAQLSDALIIFLGIFGYGLFASTLVPALALGLNWEGATRAGALASLAAGLVVTLGLEFLALQRWISLPAGVTASALSLVASLGTFLLVSAATRGGTTDELDEDLQLALRM
jgi:Na+/proline symporter